MELTESSDSNDNVHTSELLERVSNPDQTEADTPPLQQTEEATKVWSESYAQWRSRHDIGGNALKNISYKEIMNRKD